MRPQEPNRWVAWYLLVKEEWLPARRRALREWWSAVRQEPRLAWQTPQVRYGAAILGVILLAVLATSLVDALALPPPANARPQATTANFHVVCSDPECGHHFLIERKFGFSRFPVECPKCHKPSGERAARCHSSTCGGRYVATAEKEEQRYCPRCGTRLGPGS